MRIGAAVLLPFLFLLASKNSTAQERYWEVLTLFGGKDASTYDLGFCYDAKRDRYILYGMTEEPDLPVTANAMKPNFTHPVDGFIAVFNSDCSALVYCSYVGGEINSAVVDAARLDDDRLLIALSTYSHELPVTNTAWMATPPGTHNTWLAVLSLDTFQILDAGYFGGSTEDGVDRILLGNDGSIILTGHAASTDLPVTPNAFQPRKRGNADSWNAFIAIFDSTFQLTYCSYHGGSTGGEDAWKGLAETEHYIAFAGTVYSTDMPVTDDAWQKNFAGGYFDAYLCVVSKDSLKRVYSTYLGGGTSGGFSTGIKARDGIVEILPVENDRIVLVGATNSGSFPVTPNAWQPRIADDTSMIYGDNFIAVFSIPDRRFEQITYLGGSSYDYVKSAIFNKATREVLLGCTTFSLDFPLASIPDCDCSGRGVILHYDPVALAPTGAESVVDIGDNRLNTLIQTTSGDIAFSGLNHTASLSPLPVRRGGFKTVREGVFDIFIGILHDTPVAAGSLAEVLPESGELEVYPQPARDRLRFSFDDTREATATLVDLLGRRVRQVQLSGNGNTARGEMTLSGITPGVYMLVVRTDAGVRTGKVVIAR
jgi:hypothetical protein